MLSEEMKNDMNDKYNNGEYWEGKKHLLKELLPKVEQLEQQNKELAEMVYRLLYLLEDGGGFILIEEYEKYKNDTYKQIEKFFNKKWEDIINE